ncbi:unnamed protein product [Ixodes pacificus]
MSVTLKAHSAGMEFPSLAPGKLRVYVTRFCPFSHRTLLMLRAKNLAHEVVNVDLNNKPEWLFKLHPAGHVPILQQDDKILYDSTVVPEYVDEAYGQEKLMPADPYLKAKEKLFIDAATTALRPVVRVHRDVDNKVELWDKFKQGVQFHEEELKARRTLFLSGEKPGFSDYMIWPFFARALAISAVFPDLKLPTAQESPLVVRWMEAMKKDGASGALPPQDNFVRYIKSSLAGNADPDVGL